MNGLLRILAACAAVAGTAHAQDHSHHGHAHGHSDVVAAPCPPRGARLFLSAKGAISLNGKAVAANDLPQAIAKLDPRPAEICYAREKPGAEPAESRVAVARAIMGTDIPLSLYIDRAFSQRIQGK